EGKPPITPAEGEVIAGLPAVASVTPNVSTSADVRAGTAELAGTQILGRGHLWTDYARGDFIVGRNFLPSEETRAAPVAVLSEGAAQGLFGAVNPVGRFIRLGVQRFQVVGVYRPAPNPFSNAPPVWVTVPASTAVRRLGANANWYSLLVVPAEGYTQAEAMDQVTSAMRSVRGLSPREENNFAVIRQEAFTELFNRI